MDKDDDYILKWILSNRGKVEKRINGALKDAINAHGPIAYGKSNSKNNICSASKRVWGALKSLIKEIKQSKEQLKEKDG